MAQEEDRLSSMSKTIIHNILSKLPMKDAARTSVLSKTWLETWYTFTILSSCGANHGNLGLCLQLGGDIVRKRNILRLCDYVKRRMLKFCDQTLAIFISKYVHTWLKMVGESDVEEDRLSSLPKIILHNILSKLPEKDAARTSVLSKAWLETWYTFPILSFCDTKILGMNQRPQEVIVWKRNILRFCNHVTRRMLKFSDQRMVVTKFKLMANLFRLPEMSKYVDFWLKLASESGVKVIELSGSLFEEDEKYYVFPMDVIEAKSLAKLVLDGYIRIDSTIMNHSIKFLSLKELSMTRVFLEDEYTIDHLISCCPLIEYITLNHCFVKSPVFDLKYPYSPSSAKKSLNLNGLKKLKGVNVSRIQEVFVDSPSLENLHYFPKDFQGTFKIDFDRHCRMPERIDISSVQLKVFELLHCPNLKEVNIDAPNLFSCRYNGTGCTIPNSFASFIPSTKHQTLGPILCYY
ncbi:hypothetical protein TSUD_140640 [Trifolium subterraneum]|uniref:F-box domain-containing protein n=1 Tax=Trifolium subterraneum TaxID=3900 RepID=A0A2Z6NHX8_TRISU|nr:hypothetical protein TSUD_140640 [Trifolium subterraneum]